MEITNTGNGWHPHLHTVNDCRWMAWKTKEPPPHLSREEKKQRYQDAACELESVWAKIVGQETASIDIQRCSGTTVTREVLKYAVKPSDLIASPQPIGDVIRALDSTRLMTTYGHAHGRCIKEIRADAKLQAQAFAREASSLCGEAGCCPAPELYPVDITEQKETKLVNQGRAMNHGHTAALEANLKALPNQW
jgi:hypothetical protein